MTGGTVPVYVVMNPRHKSDKTKETKGWKYFLPVAEVLRDQLHASLAASRRQLRGAVAAPGFCYIICVSCQSCCICIMSNPHLGLINYDPPLNVFLLNTML